MPESTDRQLDFHPGMGMRWEITRTAAETGGELFESKNWIDPGMPGPPVHVHPNAEETFEILEGSLDFFMDGEWRAAGVGETVVIPAGAPHTLRNSSDEPAVSVTRIRPAGDSESLFRDLHRLIEEGKIRRLPPKEPRSAIYAAMVFGAYPGEIVTTKPPNWVFRAIAGVGRLLRFDLGRPAG